MLLTGEVLEYYDSIFKNYIEPNLNWRNKDDGIENKGIDSTTPAGQADELVESLYLLGEIYIHGSLSRKTFTKILIRRTKLENLQLIEVVDKLDALREETDKFRTVKDRLLHGQT